MVIARGDTRSKTFLLFRQKRRVKRKEPAEKEIEDMEKKSNNQ